MSKRENFPAVFERLKGILKPYEPGLTVKADSEDTYYLEGPATPKYKKEMFFASVQIRKNYISYYLMPVYAFPELLQGVSPALKRRMQGKSCFNFTGMDEALFAELADLTKKGYERFRAEELI